MDGLGKIIIAGAFKLPENDAGATRAVHMARSMIASGYDVCLLGMGTSSPQHYVDGKYVYNDIEYDVILDSNQSVFKKMIAFFMFPYDIIKKIKQIHSKTPVKAIIIEGPSASLCRPLIKFAKKENIKIIIDVVEWFNITHFKGGLFSMEAINHLFGFYKTYHKAENIIAISSLIEDYYEKAGCKTLLMPVTYDTSKYTVTPKNNSFPLTLAYAGMPGKKDYIANAIKGYLSVPELYEKFRIRLIGISFDNLKQMLTEDEFNKAQKHIQCDGKLPVDTAREAISAADFTVLLRPNERFANAGFPTKFVESITLGTPVILNLTSDLHRYVTDSVNCIVSKDCEPASFAEALKKIAALSSDDINKLSKNARKLAENSFDCCNFSNALKCFIEVE
ncbi:MAG: glycosyltransferase [Bacillota bacterium]|nr:glycosyltransferase [Bacillota bacterium]